MRWCQEIRFCHASSPIASRSGVESTMSVKRKVRPVRTVWSRPRRPAPPPRCGRARSDEPLERRVRGPQLELGALRVAVRVERLRQQQPGASRFVRRLDLVRDPGRAAKVLQCGRAVVLGERNRARRCCGPGPHRLRVECLGDLVEFLRSCFRLGDRPGGERGLHLRGQQPCEPEPVTGRSSSARRIPRRAASTSPRASRRSASPGAGRCRGHARRGKPGPRRPSRPCGAAARRAGER